MSKRNKIILALAAVAFVQSAALAGAAFETEFSDPAGDTYLCSGHLSGSGEVSNASSTKKQMNAVDITSIGFSDTHIFARVAGNPLTAREGNFTHTLYIEANGTQFDFAFKHTFVRRVGGARELSGDPYNGVYYYANGTTHAFAVESMGSYAGGVFSIPVPRGEDPAGFDVDAICYMYNGTTLEAGDGELYFDFVGDSVTIAGEEVTPADLGVTVDDAGDGFDWTIVWRILVICGVGIFVVLFFSPADGKCAEPIVTGAEGPSGLTKARCVFKREESVVAEPAEPVELGGGE